MDDFKECTIKEIVEMLKRYPENAKFIIADMSGTVDLKLFGGIYFDPDRNEVYLKMY